MGRDPIPNIPASLGPCVGLTLLGQGAMGAVFRARHTRLGTDVAVKVVNPRLGAKDPKLFQRFLREVELLRGVDDPHVVRFLDAGQEGAFTFAVMELVLGRTLGELRRGSPGGVMAPDAAAYYLVQVARGLDAVHRRGIVHRDVKPDNVMVDAAGRARLMDFGLARGKQSNQLTMLDEVVGTPEYMAPESIQHHEVDGRADLYSLGVSAYELLTGATPFNQGGLLKVVQDHVSRAPIPVEVKRPQVPPELARIVARLMQKRAEARFATGAEAAAALAPLACARPPHVVAPAPAHAARPPAPTPVTPSPARAPGGARPGWGTPVAASAAPADLPRWEDLLAVRLLARHGVLPLDDLLDRLRAYQDPARALGAPSFVAYLGRTAGLPARVAEQAGQAARKAEVALRERIALSILRRAGRVPGDALERAAREAAGRPLVDVLVERQHLRREDAPALAARVEQALGLAARRAAEAARAAAGAAGPEAVRRDALRRLVAML
ncbi:MAG: serine/threonine protein kinase [Planctomycetes bacterium]|nr:serine/threonine protein kinase [Planctomycetota bacterium]